VVPADMDWADIGDLAASSCSVPGDRQEDKPASTDSAVPDHDLERRSLHELVSRASGRRTWHRDIRDLRTDSGGHCGHLSLDRSAPCR